MELGIVRDRDTLKPRREPYWQRLSARCFLGFRPSAVGSGGSWIARFYDTATRRKTIKALGDFGELPPSDRHGAAKRDAEQWFAHLLSGGSRKMVTVRDVCEIYADNKPDAAGRFRRYVYEDPIAAVKLVKLTKDDVRAWRKRMEAMPALVTRSKSKTPRHRPRSLSTINRDITSFRAALNLARDHDAVMTDNAWRVALRPAENVDRRRNLYLDRDQRRALLERLAEDIAPFVRALCVLPLRPGALAALLVEDLDPRRSELRIGTDKAGQDRRILLPAATATTLKEQARRKLPRAPLFAQANGKAWNKDAWKGPFKLAARDAGLPAAASCYTLRHSTITDLVTGGLDLLTVAQLSGTSVAMIERHYGHLQRHKAADALARLEL